MIKLIDLVSLLADLVLIVCRKPGQISAGLVITGLICLAIVTISVVVYNRGGFKRPPRIE
jgi:hypothetical protein